MKQIILVVLLFLTACTVLKPYEDEELNGVYRRTTENKLITLCNGLYQEDDKEPLPYMWVNNAQVWIDGEVYNYRYEHIVNSGTYLTLYVQGEVWVFKKVYPAICDESINN